MERSYTSMERRFTGIICRRSRLQLLTPPPPSQIPAARSLSLILPQSPLAHLRHPCTMDQTCWQWKSIKEAEHHQISCLSWRLLVILPQARVESAFNPKERYSRRRVWGELGG